MRYFMIFFCSFGMILCFIMAGITFSQDSMPLGARFAIGGVQIMLGLVNVPGIINNVKE
jgi:hypothetical protein